MKKKVRVKILKYIAKLLTPYIDKELNIKKCNAIDWVKYTNKDGKVGRRETNTMPGSAASSWYFMRYIDPKNDNEFANKE